jgi:hypothetical protein
MVRLNQFGKRKHRIWEEKAPDLDTILQNIAKTQKTTENSSLLSTNYSPYSPLKAGDANGQITKIMV